MRCAEDGLLALAPSEGFGCGVSAPGHGPSFMLLEILPEDRLSAETPKFVRVA